MKTSNDVQTPAEGAQKKVTRKELMSVFWRSFAINASFNYERQMSQGYDFSMIPVLKKLYPNKEDLSEALVRHAEFFNITPGVAPLALGISAAMEEQNANSDDFDVASINSVKAALMGPLSGIGDSVFWGTLRPLIAGVACSLAQAGNAFAPIFFLVAFNIINVGCRYICTFKGYELGTSFLVKVEQSGIMQKVFKYAAVIGLLVIGAMSASMVSITLAPAIGAGEAAITIDSVINGIMPKMLSLLSVMFIYRLVHKGVSVNKILVGIITVGILGCLVGLF